MWLAAEAMVSVSPREAAWPSRRARARHSCLPEARSEGTASARSARDLTRIEESMPPPANTGEPAARRRERRGVVGGRHRAPPPIEPASRRGRIDPVPRRKRPAELRKVPSRVLEYVGKRAAHFGRRSKHPRVVAVSEHRATTAEDTVRRPRNTSTDRTHTVRQGASVRGLDDQVQVVRLHGVVEHAKTAAVARRAEAPLHLANEAPTAERGYACPDSQRHVAGMPRRESRPAFVSDTTHRPRPSPRTRPGTTPAEAMAERKFLLTPNGLDSSGVLRHGAESATGL